MAEVRVEYPKHWFLVMAFIFESILVYLFLASLLDENSIWRDFWLVLSPTAAVLLSIVLVPPIFTHHTAGEQGLRLRMGLLVDETVPYASIKEIRETSIARGPVKIGIGVRYVPVARRLFVTSGFTNLVLVKLSEPRLMGRMMKRQVEEIVFNVSHPRGFLDTVGHRASSLSEG